MPLIVMVLFMISLIIGSGTIKTVKAQEGPDRVTWISVDASAYDWWLVRWSDNSIACQFTLDHEGAPTENEIQKICGDHILNEWLSTPP